MYDAERPQHLESSRRPERPEPPQRSSSGSLLPVLMVSAPLVVLITGLVAFTGRAGLLMLAVIAALPAFVLLHYLLWGRLLSKNLKNAPPEEAESRDDSPG